MSDKLNAAQLREILQRCRQLAKQRKRRTYTWVAAFDRAWTRSA